MPQRKSTQRKWWMYERRADKLAPRSIFIKRIVGALGIGSGVIFVALCVGIAGYHFIARFSWINSLLEASMILGGMGPVHGDELRNDAPKIFASVYALFSGLIVIVLMGIMISPVVHRVMHKFHIDENDRDGE